MTDPGELTQDEIVSRRSERRIVVLATSFGFLMFLGALVCLPGVGPVLRVYTNPTGSMLPTIRQGGYSVVSRASYGYCRYSFDSFELPITGRWPALVPQRGDIVVFRLPREQKTQYLKRVVGLPGETLALRDGRVYVGGMPIDEPYVETGVRTLPSDGQTVWQIPAGQVFVMGDGRTNSADSRIFGPIPLASLVGRPVYRCLPKAREGPIQ